MVAIHGKTEFNLELKQEVQFSNDNIRESVMYVADIIDNGATVAEPVVQNLIKYLSEVFKLQEDTDNVLKTTAVRLYCVAK